MTGCQCFKYHECEWGSGKARSGGKQEAKHGKSLGTRGVEDLVRRPHSPWIVSEKSGDHHVSIFDSAVARLLEASLR
jgi:hypothetical protein